MIVIGVNPTHNTTACLLKDGEIVCAIGEERLSRYKGEIGFPYRAVKWVMDYGRIKPEEVDALCIAMRVPTIAFNSAPVTERKGMIKLMSVWMLTVNRTLNWFLFHIPWLGKCYDFLYKEIYLRLFEKKLYDMWFKEIHRRLDIPAENIMFVDEHEYSHAYAVYWGLRKPDEKGDWLAITCSGKGDKYCSIVGVFDNDDMKIIDQTLNGNSLEAHFSESTTYFGMRLAEHEYKIMGLAPYAERRGEKIVYDRIKDVIQVEGMKFRCRWHQDAFVLYPFYKKQFEKCRFDWIAGAVQRIVEDKLCEWIGNIQEATGKRKFYVSGGVFMNVKANKRILDMPIVDDLVVMPSSDDESTCFGAAYYAQRELAKKENVVFRCESLNDLYLGPAYTLDQIIKEVEKEEHAHKYSIKMSDDIEKEMAQILACNGIVAYFNGRMEFGSRALGNRSILANPSRLEMIAILNEQIKCRDFWMPFACTILKEKEDEYIVNPKKIRAKYMAVAFDTTEKGRCDLQAGIHPYDKTVRPQVLEECDNPSYYRIIKEFEKLTGIGAVLNTSFNIHGEPIVCSPADALNAFWRSGLQYLVMSRVLISKKTFN